MNYSDGTNDAGVAIIYATGRVFCLIAAGMVAGVAFVAVCALGVSIGTALASLLP